MQLKMPQIYSEHLKECMPSLARLKRNDRGLEDSFKIKRGVLHRQENRVKERSQIDEFKSKERLGLQKGTTKNKKLLEQ